MTTLSGGLVDASVPVGQALTRASSLVARVSTPAPVVGGGGSTGTRGTGPVTQTGTPTPSIGGMRGIGFAGGLNAQNPCGVPTGGSFVGATSLATTDPVHFADVRGDRAAYDEATAEAQRKFGKAPPGVELDPRSCLVFPRPRCRSQVPAGPLGCVLNPDAVKGDGSNPPGPNDVALRPGARTQIGPVVTAVDNKFHDVNNLGDVVHNIGVAVGNLLGTEPKPGDLPTVTTDLQGNTVVTPGKGQTTGPAVGDILVGPQPPPGPPPPPPTAVVHFPLALVAALALGAYFVLRR